MELECMVGKICQEKDLTIIQVRKHSMSLQTM